MDVVGPLLGAIGFVAGMSLVREPARREVNTILVAGAAGAYLNGGFGAWELVYPALGLVLAYRALRSYRYLGIAWLAHSGWDALHHLYGDPIWPFMATSSFGCLVFDAAIATWFLADAPTFVRRRAAQRT